VCGGRKRQKGQNRSTHLEKGTLWTRGEKKKNKKTPLRKRKNGGGASFLGMHPSSEGGPVKGFPSERRGKDC